MLEQNFLQALLPLSLLVILALAVRQDLTERRIANTLTLAGLACGLVLQALVGGTSGFIDALAGAGVGLLCFLPWYLSKGMGAGDVKLMAAIGVWFGPYMTLVSFAVGAMIGGARDDDVGVEVLARDELNARLGEALDVVRDDGGLPVCDGVEQVRVRHVRDALPPRRICGREVLLDVVVGAENLAHSPDQIVRDQAVDYAKAADKAVHEHPYQAVGIAVAVGAILGYLISRRGSRNGD